MFRRLHDEEFERRHATSYRRKSVAFGFGFGLGFLIAIPAALSLAQWAGSPPQAPMTSVFAKDETADSAVRLATQVAREGDVAKAREMLSAQDMDRSADVVFALAETYDPNMLAAWNSRGVAADAGRARDLYRLASSLGMPRADRRLTLLED